MNTVIFYQMRRRFNWACCIQPDNFDVVPAAGADMGQRGSANASEPVDTYFDRHDVT